MKCSSIMMLFMAVLWTATSHAEMQFEVVTGQGTAVPHAVVSAGRIVTEPANATASMDQVDKMFLPYVLTVQKGTYVDFPNSDQVRHHVYSFSKAKPFELRLYSGSPEKPIFFDTAGIAVLGCNIHDNMVGYIYISDREFWGLTNGEGHLSIPDLQPTGEVTVWHPGLSLTAQEEITIKVAELPRRGDRYQIVLDIAEPSLNPQAVRTDDNRFKRFLKR